MHSFARAGLLLSLGLTAHAHALDILNIYGGASVGLGRVEADSGGEVPSTDHFRENHFAYKGLVGIRPLSWIGAEIEYVDFGHPHGTLGGAPADVRVHGPAVFGVVGLPFPIVDAFLKVGVDRAKSTVNGEAFQACTALSPCPQSNSFRVERTSTGFAFGAGAQYKIGSLGFRAEYERFGTSGSHPQLVSVGLTWTFL